MELDIRELSAVLAGLRILQLEMEFGSPTYHSMMPALLNILSNKDTLVPLTLEEIDELCERLNTGG